MGTNFYLRNKMEFQHSQEENSKLNIKIDAIIQQIQTIIDNEGNVRRIRDLIEQDACVEYERIHIGLRSSHWKPSFEKQPQFSSVRELKSFYDANQEDYDIVDEHGRVYDWSGLERELIFWNPDGKERGDSYKDEDGYIWHDYPFI